MVWKLQQPHKCIQQGGRLRSDCTSGHYCADNIAAPTNRKVWLHFCTMGGSEVVSSVCYTVIDSHSVCCHVGRGQSSRADASVWAVSQRLQTPGPPWPPLNGSRSPRVFSQAYFHSLALWLCLWEWCNHCQSPTLLYLRLSLDFCI